MLWSTSFCTSGIRTLKDGEREDRRENNSEQLLENCHGGFIAYISKRKDLILLLWFASQDHHHQHYSYFHVKQSSKYWDFHRVLTINNFTRFFKFQFSIKKKSSRFYFLHLFYFWAKFQKYHLREREAKEKNLKLDLIVFYWGILNLQRFHRNIHCNLQKSEQTPYFLQIAFFAFLATKIAQKLV